MLHKKESQKSMKQSTKNKVKSLYKIASIRTLTTPQKYKRILTQESKNTAD
jgi:ribosomal protein L23